MKTFISHYLNDDVRAVEFTAETIQEAEEIAKEHNLAPPREVRLMVTAPGDSSVEDVIEKTKTMVDKENSILH